MAYIRRQHSLVAIKRHQTTYSVSLPLPRANARPTRTAPMASDATSWFVRYCTCEEGTTSELSPHADAIDARWQRVKLTLSKIDAAVVRDDPEDCRAMEVAFFKACSQLLVEFAGTYAQLDRSLQWARRPTRTTGEPEAERAQALTDLSVRLEGLDRLSPDIITDTYQYSFGDEPKAKQDGCAAIQQALSAGYDALEEVRVEFKDAPPQALDVILRDRALPELLKYMHHALLSSDCELLEPERILAAILSVGDLWEEHGTPPELDPHDEEGSLMNEICDVLSERQGWIASPKSAGKWQEFSFGYAVARGLMECAFVVRFAGADADGRCLARRTGMARDARERLRACMGDHHLYVGQPSGDYPHDIAMAQELAAEIGTYVTRVQDQNRLPAQGTCKVLGELCARLEKVLALRLRECEDQNDPELQFVEKNKDIYVLNATDAVVQRSECRLPAASVRAPSGACRTSYSELRGTAGSFMEVLRFRLAHDACDLRRYSHRDDDTVRAEILTALGVSTLHSDACGGLHCRGKTPEELRDMCEQLRRRATFLLRVYSQEVEPQHPLASDEDAARSRISLLLRTNEDYLGEECAFNVYWRRMQYHAAFLKLTLSREDLGCAVSGAAMITKCNAASFGIAHPPLSVDLQVVRDLRPAEALIRECFQCKAGAWRMFYDFGACVRPDEFDKFGARACARRVCSSPEWATGCAETRLRIVAVLDDLLAQATDAVTSHTEEMCGAVDRFASRQELPESVWQRAASLGTQVSVTVSRAIDAVEYTPRGPILAQYEKGIETFHRYETTMAQRLRGAFTKLYECVVVAWRGAWRIDTKERRSLYEKHAAFLYHWLQCQMHERPQDPATPKQFAQDLRRRLSEDPDSRGDDAQLRELLQRETDLFLRLGSSGVHAAATTTEVSDDDSDDDQCFHETLRARGRGVAAVSDDDSDDDYGY